jgi:hypothetical protein
MGKQHELKFTNWDRVHKLVSEEATADFVEMFYRWPACNFEFVAFQSAHEWKNFFSEKKTNYKLVGEHRYYGFGGHRISLIVDNLEKYFAKGSPLGGNVCSPSLQVSAAMVLAHELQHANQVKMHAASSAFYDDHKYIDRACEREARNFADEKFGEICVYYGIETPLKKQVIRPTDEQSELEAIKDLLLECHSVTMDDVKDELRASKLLNPKNVKNIISDLRLAGVKI